MRFLRPVQITERVRVRLVSPRPDPRRAPKVRTATGRWTPPAARAASLVGPERFVFLNEEGDLSAHGWDDASMPKLWRYNLHYFDDLTALGADRRKAWHGALIARWIAENPAGRGTGWEPYPTSLRIVNWIKWALAGHRLPDEAVAALAVQARWLERRLEYHLLGNHLISNAKALVFAGSYFEGEEAARWRKKGAAILDREVPEQILADGGQFERSPMYHALALEDLLDLQNLARALPDAIAGASSEAWFDRIVPMRNWLAAMCHPDGEIGFFNDAALGIASSPHELSRYARDLGRGEPDMSTDGVRHLEDSGYVRVVHGPMVAILDVAPIGPSYLPGHAHADTLSFELSLGPQRILVNSGTSVYGTGAERLRQRGTAAHNTVVVDGEDSSEVWSGFRVARRASPRGLSIAEDDGLVVSCEHDGYRRLSGRPVHRRTWRFASRELLIEDHVSGPARDATARFHFHPDMRIGGASASTPDGRRFCWSVEHGAGHLEPGTHHPRFGVTLASQVLAVRLADGRSRVRFGWS